jgi:hypothetical protein
MIWSRRLIIGFFCVTFCRLCFDRVQSKDDYQKPDQNPAADQPAAQKGYSIRFGNTAGEKLSAVTVSWIGA